jgi:hypothetical protein
MLRYPDNRFWPYAFTGVQAMPEQPTAPSPTVSQIQASLHEIAQVLRAPQHLEPETQDALADLVDELSKALEQAAIPSAETAHLADSAAQLAKAVHQRRSSTLLAAARDRLDQAALRAENEAPVTAGLVRRLLDTLADLGI